MIYWALGMPALSIRSMAYQQTGPAGRADETELA
jgi:hypothetical protein